MIEIIRQDFPLMADSDEGRFVPFVFGYVQRLIPIGIVIGPTDKLGNDVPDHDDGLGIKLTTLTIFDRFPATGKIQIGSERMTYAGSVRAQLLLTGITRGVDVTTIAKHSKGDQVYLVLPQFKYIICENPRFVHFTQLIAAVYLNGVLVKNTDPPTWTINMDDRDTVGGRSVVTITFDLTTLTGANVASQPAPPPAGISYVSDGVAYVPPPLGVYNPLMYATSGSLTGGSGAGSAWLRRGWYKLRYGRKLARERAKADRELAELRLGQTGTSEGFRFGRGGSITGGGLQPGQYYVNPGSGNPFGLITRGYEPSPGQGPSSPRPSPAPIPPPPRPVATVTSVSAPTSVKQIPAPVIGQVEVDLFGLQDDSIGTITGTPNLLLDRPAWIVRTVLREAWGELNDANYNLTSFANTHTQQVIDGIHWAMVFDGSQQFSSFRDQVMLEGKAHLFQWAGLWYYVYRKRIAPQVTVTPREIIGKGQPIFALSQRTNLTTELVLTWQHERNSTSGQRRVLRSTRGIQKYGVQRNRQLALRWVWEDAPALLLGNYWLRQWDTQRLQVAIPSTWVLANMVGWDTFLVDVPVMKLWGPKQIAFHLTDMSYNPDTGSYSASGTQADESAIVLDGTFFVSAPKTITLDGTFVVAGGGAAELARGQEKIVTGGPPGMPGLRITY